VWVWNVKDLDAAAIPEYYPGDAYVDVVSLDAWMNPFPPAEYYDTLRSLANGKPIALGEVGHIPSPSELAAQPEWTYFMVWAEYVTGSNSEEAIEATYDDPRALNQGELGVR
jgi:mannan endo-1,4-beta-mannosidase